MDPNVRTVEEIAARIARSRKGLVTRAQLLSNGVSPTEIRGRVKASALIREYRGVYRVGHAAPSIETSYLAAVLACGDDCGLSGLPAAYLMSLIKGQPPKPEVTCRTEKRIPKLKTKRCRSLTRRDLTVVRGIPTTTVPRTLVDIAADLPLQALSRACHEAGVRYRTTPRHVDEVLTRRPNAPGAAKLRAVMSGDTPMLLSKLEEGFLALLRAHNLPLPQTNRPAGGHYVDCRWPEHHLPGALDSYRFHNSRHSWEADRRRERQAYARGDQFRRFTWGDVFERADALLREVASLVASAAA